MKRVNTELQNGWTPGTAFWNVDECKKCVEMSLWLCLRKKGKAFHFVSDPCLLAAAGSPQMCPSPRTQVKLRGRRGWCWLKRAVYGTSSRGGHGEPRWLQWCYVVKGQTKKGHKPTMRMFFYLPESVCVHCSFVLLQTCSLRCSCSGCSMPPGCLIIPPLLLESQSVLQIILFWKHVCGY